LNPLNIESQTVQINQSSSMYNSVKGMILLPLLAITTLVNAQNGQPATKTADSAATKKSTIKPYKEVITSKAVSKWGMFGVHNVDEKYYFEIPDSLLKREVLFTTRLVKVPTGSPLFGGEIVNSIIVSFEKAGEENLYMRVLPMVLVATPTNAIAKQCATILSIP